MNENTEIDKIEKLLKTNNLPYEDIISSKVEFITFKSNEALVGCIGIEKYGEDGLLRSLAVGDEYKNTGIGKKLLNELISKCKNEGITKLHLLTTTADKYFAKKGFKYSERTNAPKAILNSKEFLEICPSSSVYMMMEIK
ncbi:arsenic resistance N-acetyltransferase ArsN2 [Pontibacter sp. 13R65]|uniref:arsenic resistance N-acetyltransferase ArsN2 n=1 Tax=Pontibacter sp. 13R65 TaxID=3127458 RepID=UPI00301C30CA